MLVFSNNGKSVKCVNETDEFWGYNNETEAIQQMLTNKTKEITAFESTEPAHLSQCNPLTERMWVNGVSKIPEEDFIVDENGEFYIKAAHKFTYLVDQWSTNELCFSTLSHEGKQVVVFATCIDVPPDEQLSASCHSRPCINLCCGKENVSTLTNPFDSEKECQYPKRKPLKSPFIMNISANKDIGKHKMEHPGFKTSQLYLPYDLSNTCKEFLYSDIESQSLSHERLGDIMYLRLGDDLIKSNHYCIAQYEDHNGDESSNVLLKIRTCKNQKWHTVLYKVIGPILSSISVFSLVLAILNVWIKDRFKVHGAFKLCLLASDMILYLILSLTHHFHSIAINYPYFCNFLALAAQFAYISAMCWGSVLAFDIWRQFSTIKRQKNLTTKKKLGFCKPKFRRYIVFPFAITTINTTLTIMLPYLFDYLGGHGISALRQSKDWCLFSGMAHWYHMILPSGLIFMITLVFTSLFIHSYCFGIWSFNKNAEIPTAEKTEKVKVVMRAVVIMGLVWMVDLINAAYVKSFNYGNFSDTSLILQSCLNWINYLNGLWLAIAIMSHRYDINEARKKFLQTFLTSKRNDFKKNVSNNRVSHENSIRKDETFSNGTIVTTKV